MARAMHAGKHVSSRRVPCMLVKKHVSNRRRLVQIMLAYHEQPRRDPQVTSKTWQGTERGGGGLPGKLGGLGVGGEGGWPGRPGPMATGL